MINAIIILKSINIAHTIILQSQNTCNNGFASTCLGDIRDLLKYFPTQIKAITDLQVITCHDYGLFTAFSHHHFKLNYLIINWLQWSSLILQQIFFLLNYKVN